MIDTVRGSIAFARVRLTAPQVYLTIRCLSALADSIMFTTYALYYINMLGFTPLQLVLVGTAVELAVVLFEIPTGVVADVYSRRLSVIIGTLVMGAAYVLEGAVPFLGGVLPFFGLVVVAEVIRGLGWTFISGAQTAWITDEVGREHTGPLFLRASKLSRLMSLGGIGASVLLANAGLYLPFLVGGALTVGLGLFLVAAMPETRFTPRPREQGSHLRTMGATFMEGVRTVRGRPVLLALLMFSLIAGAASEGYDRLWSAHFLTTFQLEQISRLTPATWFGVFSVAGTGLSMAAAHWGEKRLDLTTPQAINRTLLVLAGLRTAAMAGFALAPAFGWALALNLFIKATGSLYHPIYDTWVNQQVDSKHRATVLSMLGQADAIGQSGGGPVVGLIGARFSLRAALVVAAAFLAPAAGLFAWTRHVIAERSVAVGVSRRSV